ncbi:hypothetical protein NFJ02_03g104930 [Pycnococcus provasolii]
MAVPSSLLPWCLVALLLLASLQCHGASAQEDNTNNSTGTGEDVALGDVFDVTLPPPTGSMIDYAAAPEPSDDEYEEYALGEMGKYDEDYKDYNDGPVLELAAERGMRGALQTG